jgi:hypothetical protein
VTGTTKYLWLKHLEGPFFGPSQEGEIDDDDGKHVRWATARAMLDFDMPNLDKTYLKLNSTVVSPSNLEAMRMSTARGVINRDTLSQLGVMRGLGAVHARKSRTFEHYFKLMLDIFEPMRGGDYSSSNDARLLKMELALAELVRWKESLEPAEVLRGFISLQLFWDIQSLVRGWRHTLEQLEKLVAAGTIPALAPFSPTAVAQDRTEGTFGEIRGLYAGGSPTFANALSALYVIDVLHDARKADQTDIQATFSSAVRRGKMNAPPPKAAVLPPSAAAAAPAPHKSTPRAAAYPNFSQKQVLDLREAAAAQRTAHAAQQPPSAPPTVAMDCSD